MRRWIEDILVGLAAWGALYLAFTHGKQVSAFPQWGEEVIEGIIAIIIAYAVRVMRLRKQVGLLIEHYGEVSGVVRRATFALFTPRLKRELDALNPLTTSGVLVDATEIEAFVDACFRCCEGAYQGTDSHPPTKFFELYPTYLLKQQRRRFHANVTLDTRFLLVEEAALVEDYQRDPESVTDFVTMHLQKDIRLLQVDPSVAARLAQNLPSSDIGVFGWKYVVFYQPPAVTGCDSYRVILQPLDEGMSARIGKYLLDLNESARRISNSSNEILLVTRDQEEVQDCRQRVLWGSRYGS